MGNICRVKKKQVLSFKAVAQQQSEHFKPLNMRRQQTSNVSSNGYDGGKKKKNSPFSVGVASLFLDIKTTQKTKVYREKFVRMCRKEWYLNRRGISARGQAAMASPVSSKLSPVENTVAPGNRKHTRQAGHCSTAHIRRGFQNKIRKSVWIENTTSVHILQNKGGSAINLIA